MIHKKLCLMALIFGLAFWQQSMEAVSFRDVRSNLQMVRTSAVSFLCRNKYSLTIASFAALGAVAGYKNSSVEDGVLSTTLNTTEGALTMALLALKGPQLVFDIVDGIKGFFK